MGKAVCGPNMLVAACHILSELMEKLVCLSVGQTHPPTRCIQVCPSVSEVINLSISVNLSQSSHHPQEVLLAQFSLFAHKGGLKPDSFHFISVNY